MHVSLVPATLFLEIYQEYLRMWTNIEIQGKDINKCNDKIVLVKYITVQKYTHNGILP